MMGENEQMQNYERMIKRYQLQKSDLTTRMKEHPGEADAINRSMSKIDEEIASIHKVMENMKQRQLREAKFRPVQRAVPQTYTPDLAGEKPPQEKTLRKITHGDFARLEPPAKNEFLQAAQKAKQAAMDGSFKPGTHDPNVERSAKLPKDISGAHAKEGTQTQNKGERIVSLLDEEEN